MKIPINGYKVENSKYSDVRIVSYRPPVKAGEKASIVVEFVIRKIIYAENEKELIEQIEDELEMA